MNDLKNEIVRLLSLVLMDTVIDLLIYLTRKASLSQDCPRQDKHQYELQTASITGWKLNINVIVSAEAEALSITNLLFVFFVVFFVIQSILMSEYHIVTD